VDISESLAELGLLVPDDPDGLDISAFRRPPLGLDELFKEHPDILVLCSIIETAHKETLLWVGPARKPGVALAHRIRSRRERDSRGQPKRVDTDGTFEQDGAVCSERLGGSCERVEDGRDVARSVGVGIAKDNVGIT
jgi:hypothetical protein